MLRKSLTVFVLLMLVVSVPVAGIGSVAAQTDTTTDDSGSSDGVVQKCADNVDANVWSVVFPVNDAYECLQGAISPSDVDIENSAEVESSAWNSALSTADRIDSAQSSYEEWSYASETSALQAAEGPIYDAHAAEKDKAEARLAGIEATQDHYSARITKDLQLQTSVINNMQSISQITRDAEGVSQMVVDTSRTELERINITNVVREDVSLPNGEDVQDVAVAFDAEDSNGNVTRYYMTETYTGETDATNVDGVDSVDMITTNDYDTPYQVFEAQSPYGDETVTFDLESINQRISGSYSESEDVVSKVQTMTDNLYSTHEKGSIDPDEYVSPQTLTERYAGEDDHFSYPAALASINGLTTDLDTTQTIRIGGSNGETYDGILMLAPDADPSASTLLSNYGSVTASTLNSENVFTVDDGEAETVTFDVSDGSSGTIDYNIDVSGVTDFSTSESGSEVTVTVAEENVKESMSVIMITFTDETNGTTQYVHGYTSSDATGDIVIPVTQNDAAQVSLPSDATAQLAYQDGDTADVMDISGQTVQVTDATKNGEEIGVITFSDGQNRDFTNTSNLTDELETAETVDDRIDDRDDVAVPTNTAGAGGVVNGVPAWIEGIFAGGFLVFFGIFGLVVLIVVLYLTGRITSVA